MLGQCKWRVNWNENVVHTKKKKDNEDFSYSKEDCHQKCFLASFKVNENMSFINLPSYVQR